jgi:hypothetical protein
MTRVRIRTKALAAVSMFAADKRDTDSYYLLSRHGRNQTGKVIAAGKDEHAYRYLPIKCLVNYYATELSAIRKFRYKQRTKCCKRS